MNPGSEALALAPRMRRYLNASRGEVHGFVPVGRRLHGATLGCTAA